MGIFISSFRDRDDIATSGWWKVFPHREWRPVREIDLTQLGLDPNGVMQIEGATGTFEEFREGIETPDGKRVTWIGNKRLGKVEIQEQVWTVTLEFHAGQLPTGPGRAGFHLYACRRYQGGGSRRQHGRSIPEQPVGGRSIDRDPHPDRRVRGLCLCLDEVSRAGARCSSWSWRCRWCRCRSPWCPS